MSPRAVALREAVQKLQAAGIAESARDARWILGWVLEIAPDRLTLELADPMPLTDAQRAKWDAAIAARAARQPVAQIIGRRAFWGRDFRVTRDTLDPRPETETLIAAALEAPFSRLLDMGTGTGCIGLTLLAERPQAHGVLSDVSAPALEVAGDNARALGLSGRCVLIRSDWFAQIDGLFDLIVSNPPYITADEMAALAPDVRNWEPHGALSPGGDGLDAYRAIAAGAGAHLAPAGRLLVEIGARQGADVAAILNDAGFSDITVLPDLDGRDRVVQARYIA